MKAEGLSPEEFITRSESQLIIDVRAPIEYFKGHIPKAINIPLFDDAERSEIGTLYKLKGKQSAIDRGYEIVNPKLATWIERVKKEASERQVYVYCFRGGMRSNSFTWWLNQNKIEAQLLRGGYKSYRQLALQQFEKPYQFALLGGATGSRKTDILRYIQTHLFTPTIDLEKLANHKGSVFGGIGEKNQLPQQNFEHHFFNELKNIQHPFLAEDEAMTIGYNRIPYPFWLQMKAAPLFIFHVPFELRLKKIMSDYSQAPIPVLKSAITKIGEQLGGEATKNCLALLDKNDVSSVAQIVLKHYDKAYAHKYKQKTNQTVLNLQTQTDDVVANSKLILEAFDSIWKK
jgi:tRNA 2-selenouridine synthase